MAKSRTEIKSTRVELLQAQKDRVAIEETLNGSITDVGDAIAQKEEVMVQLDAAEEALGAAETARDRAVADITDARTAVREAREQAEAGGLLRTSTQPKLNLLLLLRESV